LLASLGAQRRLVPLCIAVADLELDRLPVLHTARAATSSPVLEELALRNRIAAPAPAPAPAPVRDHAHAHDRDRGLEKEAGSETAPAAQRIRARVAVGAAAHW
jgi:hypothetical protein